MSKFKTVSCNKYHKIIELHIINIFYNNNQKNVLTDIFSFFSKNSQNYSYGCFLSIQVTQNEQVKKQTNMGECHRVKSPDGWKEREKKIL